MLVNYNTPFPTQNPVSLDSWKPETDLEKAVDVINKRYYYYKRLYDYYDGFHDLSFAVEQFRNAFGSLFKEFADNLCPIVIDSIVDRLELIGFTLETEKNNDTVINMPPNDTTFNNQEIKDNNTLTIPKRQKTIADEAWDLWRVCRMKQVQHQIHLEAILAGDSYLLVWTNPEDESEVIAYPQKAQQFYIQDNEENPNNPDFAAKVWIENNRKRVTLYYADRIEKYISINKSGDPKKEDDFEHYNEEDGGWLIDNKYNRVPAFRFTHKSRMGSWGTSELRNVIPLQNALNKSVLDLIIAMEYSALPQRWATGVEFPKDMLTGETINPFENGSDSLWNTANENAKFGQFQNADLQQFIQVQDSFRMEIARISKTPVHYFTVQTGNAPSGSALRTIEKPLVEKCEKAQTEFGDTWEDVTEFMLLVKGVIKTTKKLQLESVWKPARSEDEKEDLETASLKKNVGVSERQVLRELGYTDEQINAMEIENTAKVNQENEQQIKMQKEMSKNNPTNSNLNK